MAKKKTKKRVVKAFQLFNSNEEQICFDNFATKAAAVAEARSVAADDLDGYDDPNTYYIHKIVGVVKARRDNIVITVEKYKG